MALTVSGDRTWSILFQNTTAQIQRNIFENADALSSGQLHDLAKSRPTQISVHSQVSSMRSDADRYQTITADLAARLDRMQLSMDRVATQTQALGKTLLSLSQNETQRSAPQIEQSARDLMTLTIGELRGSFAGQPNFASLWPDDVTTDSLLTRAAQDLDPSDPDILTKTYDWIETQLADVAPVDTEIKVGAGQSLRVSTKDSLQSTVQTLAAATVAHMTAGSNSFDSNLVKLGTNMLSAHDSWIQSQSRLGALQERTEHLQTQAAANSYAYRYQITEMLEIDPAQKAIELQTSQDQLEKIYVLTARLSKLTLMDVL